MFTLTLSWGQGIIWPQRPDYLPKYSSLESVLDPEVNVALLSHQDPVPPKWCFPRFPKEGPTLKWYYKTEATFLDATELRNVPLIAIIGPVVACRGPRLPAELGPNTDIDSRPM